MKTCPDCAEEVQDAARVCKHCGFRFESPPSGEGLLARAKQLASDSFAAARKEAENYGKSPPGWYPDPWRSGKMRWFSGEEWTDRYREPSTAAEAAGIESLAPKDGEQQSDPSGGRSAGDPSEQLTDHVEGPGRPRSREERSPGELNKGAAQPVQDASQGARPTSIPQRRVRSSPVLGPPIGRRGWVIALITGLAGLSVGGIVSFVGPTESEKAAARKDATAEVRKDRQITVTQTVPRTQTQTLTQVETQTQTVQAP